MGTLYALIAGLMWGLVFVGPLLLADYPAAMLSFGRYLAFGLIALPLGWLDRRALRELTRSDWLEALKLSMVGNIIYYLCLSAAIQRAGGPLPTMIIGTLPVVIAITANRRNAQRDGLLPWSRLAPPLLLIAGGIALVNQHEMQVLQQAQAAELGRYLQGVALAIGAVVCWTWYPIRNADWLRAHAERSPRTWATAQGLATLPLAVVGFAATWGVFAATDAPWAMPFGPRPEAYVGLMLLIGLCASWLGTLCWNEASQRLPTTLAGQLIIFETLAALAYAYVLRGTLPDAWTAAGIGLLIAGVILALRVKPVSGRPE